MWDTINFWWTTLMTSQGSDKIPPFLNRLALIRSLLYFASWKRPSFNRRSKNSSQIHETRVFRSVVFTQLSMYIILVSVAGSAAERVGQTGHACYSRTCLQCKLKWWFISPPPFPLPISRLVTVSLPARLTQTYTRRWINVVLMLFQRRRRGPTLNNALFLQGTSVDQQQIMTQH